MPTELKAACQSVVEDMPCFREDLTDLAHDANTEVCQSLVAKMEAKQSVTDLQAHLVGLESRWAKDTLLKNFCYTLLFKGHHSLTHLETFIGKYHQLFVDYFFPADKEQKRSVVRTILTAVYSVFGSFPSYLKHTINLLLVRLIVPPTAAASWLTAKLVEKLNSIEDV